MKLKIITRVLLVVLALAAGLAAYGAYSIASYADGSDDGRADAAVVLGAAVWGESPSPVFRERINHAIALYRADRVKKLIFTGAPDSSNEPAESAAAKAYAMKQGVPAADILVEDRSRTTEENLRYALLLSRAHGLRTLLIVSDPLHMKRAMLMAKDLGMDARQAPTPTTRVRSLGSKALFLSRELYYFASYHVKKLACGPACLD
jgi:uncharacterized SAM-binding protein YcdF (DUF218 family)